ncbi:MAG TPA: hypothetical protein PLU81_15740 [Deltaproteobacteria bacterium]|mgnify:CR=1 FL=1|nr:hypothetical protein [Alphaproteobacteria bacterium]HPR53247.1 hypothetical protein [Deltaproteobacteria bacterium]
MSEQVETKREVPPYVPYKTFKNFLDSMKVALPDRIDRSLMRSMSGSLQRQLIAALEYMKLIQPITGATTEKLDKLVKSEGAERKQILKDIIKTSYPLLFREGFNLNAATTQQLVEIFADYGISGDTTRKCMAFFMYACDDAGIAISPHVKRTPGPKAGAPRLRKKSNSVGKPVVDPDDEADDPGSESGSSGSGSLPGANSWEMELLSKFPSFDPSWPDDVKAKWFDGFKELMAVKKK